MTVAKHIATYEEVHARKTDVRSMIVLLGAQGYGDWTRNEAKDMDNLRLELADLRTWLYAQDKPVATV